MNSQVQEQPKPWRRTLAKVTAQDQDTLSLELPVYDKVLVVQRQQVPADINRDNQWLYLRAQLNPETAEVSLKDFMALDQPRSFSWPGLGS